MHLDRLSLIQLLDLLSAREISCVELMIVDAGSHRGHAAEAERRRQPASARRDAGGRRSGRRATRRRRRSAAGRRAPRRQGPRGRGRHGDVHGLARVPRSGGRGRFDPGGAATRRPVRSSSARRTRRSSGSPRSPRTPCSASPARPGTRSARPAALAAVPRRCWPAECCRWLPPRTAAARSVFPASFTGAFGLKPSQGRIPRGPMKAWDYGSTAVYGPLTRTVEDGALFLDLVAGPSPCDPGSLPHPGLSYRDVLEFGDSPSSLRIAWSPDLGYARVQSDVAHGWPRTRRPCSIRPASRSNRSRSTCRAARRCSPRPGARWATS